ETAGGRRWKSGFSFANYQGVFQRYRVLCSAENVKRIPRRDLRTANYATLWAVKSAEELRGTRGVSALSCGRQWVAAGVVRIRAKIHRTYPHVRACVQIEGYVFSRSRRWPVEHDGLDRR